jgi:hypothetical protein
MNPTRLIPLLLVCLAAGLATASAATPQTVSIPRSVLLDKIKGGWAGQMIGVCYGAPTEFKSNAAIITWDTPWKAGSLEGALDQDDLYVEMTFAKVMDDVGLDATALQYGEAFRNSKYNLWHANAGARRLLNMGIQPPWSGHPKYNAHSDDIDFQIEADFIGLMCPGLPRESNFFCDRVGHVMNYGDGVYGGMFVTGMYAAAFTESDPRRIVETGLACLPRESTYARLISDLLRWSAENPQDWSKVWRLLEDRWAKDDLCPNGVKSDFNIDAKINGAYIALGLLYGGGDFTKTMEIATHCGKDSDCNPSSAAGVLGVVLGYEKIPELYRKELGPLADRKFNFTDYSFNAIVRSTEARALKVIQRAGGSVTAEAVGIPVQAPVAAALEQWNPGVPDQRILVANSAWRLTGKWEERKASYGSVTRRCKGSGNEAELRFRGTGLALLGAMHPFGGRADVYVDGVKQDLPFDAYNDEKTHDDIVWQLFGLSSGEHTVRVVALDQSNPRSKGGDVSITGAVIYRAP